MNPAMQGQEAPLLAAALAAAATTLQRAGIDTARLDAEVLLAEVSGTTRSHLLAALHQPLRAGVADDFAALIARRARREPLAYIVGRQEFWSLDFAVTPAVLIPRPETELLVETAAAALRAAPRPRIADIGTGSGCIAIALAHELPQASVWATDALPGALTVARRNAERLGVAGRVNFTRGDLLAPLVAVAPFDAICSNPPYVSTADAASLPPELGYEPAPALFADSPDGLAVIRRLIAAAPAVLAPAGSLLVEIGFGQADAVRELAAAAGFTGVEIRNDYAGIPRLLVAQASVPASSRPATQARRPAPPKPEAE